MDERLITRFGKNYLIEKEIGRGGMGSVYLATDTRLDRRVAIKVLSLSAENADANSLQEIIERFQREGKAIAKLSHSNIVNIYDIGEEENKYYMVMEFLEGKPLSILINDKKRLPPLLAVSIGVQICNALEYAHENGIIHRDVKPANIILSKKGVAKLTDFGIAQLNQEQAKLTQAGSLLGSIMYIPPEQLHNSAGVDHRADIYSLGITLYELITGVLPFNSDTISELFMKILTETPKPASSHYADIPSVLDLIISKALLKDAGERYQSAREMGRDLAKLIDSDAIANSNVSSFFTTENNYLFEESNEFASTRINSPTGLSTNTIMRKTSIDNSIIHTLRKNYLWIENLLGSWKTEQITRISMDQVIHKVMEPSLYGKAFSGALIVDKAIYAFIYDGYFIGAVNTSNNLTGERVFQSMPENPSSIELKIPEDDTLYSIIIIASILSENGEVLHKSLDSSLVNLQPLIDNLTTGEEPFSGYLSCYTESNIYYYGYYKGQLLFSIPVNKLAVSNEETDQLDLKHLVLNQGIILNAYNAKSSVAGPTIFNLLKKAEVIFNYKDNDQSNLYDIVDKANEEVPIHIIKQVKQNTTLELKLQQATKLNIFDQEINLTDVIKSSVYYRFSQWLIDEYFYLLNSSGNIVSLKYIYSWIAAIENFKFFESLEGEDGKNYEFSIVSHGQVKGENYKKVLMLVRFGPGSKSEVNRFIEETIQVKKKLIKSGDIGGAIYISTDEYSSDSLKLFYERTVEPRKGFGLGSLDKLTKYKGFVRIGFGRGFHLNLLEYKEANNSFEVIAPLLK